MPRNARLRLLEARVSQSLLVMFHSTRGLRKGWLVWWAAFLAIAITASFWATPWAATVMRAVDAIVVAGTGLCAWRILRRRCWHCRIPLPHFTRVEYGPLGTPERDARCPNCLAIVPLEPLK